MSINRVVLVGRMVRDPEMRTTTTGKNVVEFSIAVDKKFKTQEQSADFFRVKAWGQAADYVNNYLTKGRLVAVDGRLDTRKYQDKDGNNREIIEVVADSVQGLDRPRDDAGGGGGGGNYGGGGGAPTSAAPAADEFDPFADE
jgi:single-strand DNA-binding protein